MQLQRRLGLAAVLLGCWALSSALAQTDPKAKEPFAKEIKLFLDRTNEARAKHKLPPVKLNDVIAKAATAYSAVMVKHDKKAKALMEKQDDKIHELEGKNVNKRLDDAGYDWTECGENVAIAQRADQFSEVFDALMKSKYHRDNILRDKYDEMGIGIVKHPDRAEWYITQIFGRQ